MKPIKELLEQLPEPYRSQALENHANTPPEFWDKYGFDREAETQVMAVGNGFSWEGSPQGWEYWCAFHDSLKPTDSQEQPEPEDPRLVLKEIFTNHWKVLPPELVERIEKAM